MKSRLVMLVLAFVLILGLVPVVGAQDTGCYGLSDADCKLMLDAEANSVNIKAFNVSFTLDFSVDASALMMMMGDATSSGAIAVKASGSGAISMAADAADPLKAIAMKMDLQGSTNDGTGAYTVYFQFSSSKMVFSMLQTPPMARGTVLS